MLKLYYEAKQIGLDTGLEIDPIAGLKSQIPFFSCYSHVLDQSCQHDIQRYVYCDKTGTSPYKGSYGNTPSLWISKFFVIKKALHLHEKAAYNKSKKKRKKQNKLRSKHGG
tara:strand:- start:1020 stop:1352 length:333 start_codon:yes stop_codon:yes gene_type:complete